MAVIDRYADVQKIYLAFYQRAAESSGMRFWAQALDAANGNLNNIINAFANSPEAARLFFPNAAQGQTLNTLVNGSNIGTVVDGIFQALFNRAPDAAGRQFYIDGFNRGQFTPGTIALAVLGGAQGSDAVSVANKLQVANDLTQIADGRLFSNPSFGQGQAFNALYGGDADTALVRQYLATVGAESTSVKSPIDTQDFLATRIADAGDPIRIVQYAPTVTGGSVVEGNGGGAPNATVTFTVVLDKPAPTGGLVLNVAASSAGTATVGTDFVLPSNTLTIAAGQTTATYTVTVLGELAVEANEQIVLSFSNASRLPTAATGASTIVNDDIPITLTVGNVSVAEGNPPLLLGSNTTTMTFTLSLSEPAPAGGTTFSVRALSTSTATAGQDFALSASTVTVAAGQSSATYTVTVGGDNAFEADETVVLEFSNPRLLNPVQATGTIRNDDAGQLYGLTVTPQAVQEGADGSGALMTYRLTLSRAAEAGGVTVNVSADPGTATQGGNPPAPGVDFVAPITSVTFAEGQQTLDYQLVVVGDNTPEPDETVVMRFSGSQLTGPVVATGVILNDDGGVVGSTFTVAASTVAEGNGGGGGLLGLGGASSNALTYTLTLNQPAPAGGATFAVAVLNTSTATSGQDYAAPPATVTVAEGQTSIVLSLPIAGDTTREANETVVLQFSNAQYGAPITATGTITNDDASPAYTITVNNPTAVEGNSGNTNALSYTVTLNRAADPGGVTLNVSVDPSSTASSGVDYVVPAGTLTIAEGQTQGTYTVNVVGDTTIEPDETLVLNFAGSTLSPLTATVQATGTIVSDEDRTINLTTSPTDLVTPGSANAATRSSDQADTISGTTGAPATLQATDTIDGGNGNDILNVSLVTDFTGFTTGSLSNVETVNLSNGSGAVRSFRAAGVTGVTTYNLQGQGATPAAINLTDLATAANLSVNLAGFLGAAVPQAISLAFATPAATAGSTDSLGLGFNALGTAATASTAALRVAPTVTGIENINATVTGANHLDLGGLTGLKEFRATGAGSLDANMVPATLTLFDASALGGSVVLNLGNTGPGLLSSVRTGAGNDAVTLELADLAAAATVAGGAGVTDKLTVVRAGGANLNQAITGFETLEFQGGTAATTLVYNAAQSSDIQTLRFVNAGTSNATVVNLPAASGLRVELDNTVAGPVGGTYQLAGVTGPVTLVSTANAGFTGTFDVSTASALTIQAAGGLGTAAPAATAIINAQTATSVRISDTATAGGQLALNAQSATSLVVDAAKEALSFTAASVLGNVQTLSLTGIDKALSLNASAALAQARTVTLGGTAADSAITIVPTLGSAAGANTLALTATGLTQGLTLGAVQQGAGTVNLSLGGLAGNLVIGQVRAQDIVFNASSYGGAAAVQGSGGGGALELFATQSVSYTGTLAQANTASLQGKSAAIVGGVQNDSITLTQVGAAAAPTLTTLNVGFSGGAGDDLLTLAVQAASNTQLTGSLDGGVNTAAPGDRLVVNVDAGSRFDLSTATLSGFESVTVNGSAAGAETLIGSAGNDSMAGLAGTDAITGGAGNDSLTGGADADVFVFAATAAGNGQDTFTDLVVGNAGDVLDFSAFAIDGNATATAPGALDPVDTMNPAAADNVSGVIVRLTDIAAGQDVTTAAGLTAALAAGGEYANMDMTANAKAVFITAAAAAAGTNYIFFATSNAGGDITAVLVGVTNNLMIGDYVAGNFLI